MRVENPPEATLRSRERARLTARRLAAATGATLNIGGEWPEVAGLDPRDVPAAFGSSRCPEPGSCLVFDPEGGRFWVRGAFIAVAVHPTNGPSAVNRLRAHRYENAWAMRGVRAER